MSGPSNNRHLCGSAKPPVPHLARTLGRRGGAACDAATGFGAFANEFAARTAADAPLSTSFGSLPRAGWRHCPLGRSRGHAPAISRRKSSNAGASEAALRGPSGAFYVQPCYRPVRPHGRAFHRTHPPRRAPCPSVPACMQSRRRDGRRGGWLFGGARLIERSELTACEPSASSRPPPRGVASPSSPFSRTAT